ncbi:16S rRNA (cytosine(1402)-N(4))-methyltransferase [Phaeobacter inhibens]|uniref:16S rRNA (cytosine(1402)-N(4))-methyltransferase n=1 Tax=Phaeobacter inhibens TaxID=221822 RepID=UPI0021A4EEE1
MTTDRPTSTGPHVPVLLRPLLKAVAPVSGRWLDGTFGAGGYSRGLLEAGADHVIGVDRDPLAFEMAESWIGDYAGRLTLQQGVFSRMDDYAQDLDGVVLDLGVSSMQLDLAERGFSFMRDGPLDMRMSQMAPPPPISSRNWMRRRWPIFCFSSVRTRQPPYCPRHRQGPHRGADYHDPAACRHHRTLPAALQTRPVTSATRSFQGLRIAVNAEYEELFEGLLAAERALKPGGLLAVVTFHSIEDRMVKRFFQHRAGKTGRANRYAPEVEETPSQFALVTRKAVGPDDEELAENPRSRSARLRVGRRTEATPIEISAKDIGMPQLKQAQGRDKRS